MGTVYKLDFASGKSYVGITTRSVAHRLGQHRGAAKRGDAALVYRAWRKYGEPSVFIIEEDVPAHELLSAEAQYVNLFDTQRPKGYNSTPGGDAVAAKQPEIRKKISDTLRGHKLSPETRAKIGAAHRGRTLPAEQRAKIGATHQGMKRSAEARANMSIAQRGRTLSAEHRAKIGAAHRGRKLELSDVDRAFRSVAALGRQHTEESKRKIGAAHKGKIIPAEMREKLAAANRGKKASAETVAKMKTTWARKAMLKTTKEFWCVN